jgi:gas vesicle protein
MNKQRTYDEQESQPARAGNFFTGLLIGGLAGAATMLLFAPQSGKATRQKIQQKTMELRDQTMATVEGTVGQIRGKTEQIKSDVRDKAYELKQQGQEVLVEQLGRVSEAAEKGKKALQGKES